MRRGEIYFIQLDPSVGSEQGGRRPVVVVSADVINVLPLVVTVIPGTDATKAPKRRFNVHVPAGEGGLRKDTAFLCFQIRAVDPSRFTDPPVGFLSSDRMDDVNEAIRYTLQV